MASKLTLVVSLFIHQGCEAEFEQFESTAAVIMRRYGGRIERRIGCAPGDGDDRPHEVHIVAFPDQQSFERYRNDDELLALAELRTRAIQRTIIWPGVERDPFRESTQ